MHARSVKLFQKSSAKAFLLSRPRLWTIFPIVGVTKPVQFVIEKRFYTDAWRALRHGSANMDVSMALRINDACFHSIYSVLRAAASKDSESTVFFETSSILIPFILLGKYLEISGKVKTSDAIAELMDLAPKIAILLTLGKTRKYNERTGN